MEPTPIDNGVPYKLVTEMVRLAPEEPPSARAWVVVAGSGFGVGASEKVVRFAVGLRVAKVEAPGSVSS